MRSRQVRVLIVESDEALGNVWRRHLERQGMRVQLTQDQESALDALKASRFDIIILNLVLKRSSSFAIADKASEIDPDVPILFVTSTSFFSDGSVFGLCANARAFLNADTPPEDLTAMVEHYARSA